MFSLLFAQRRTVHHDPLFGLTSLKFVCFNGPFSPRLYVTSAAEFSITLNQKQDSEGLLLKKYT